MSIEQKDVDAKVDELSKPGKEAELDKALSEAFNGIDADPTADPEAGQKKGEEADDAGDAGDKSNDPSKKEDGSGDGKDSKENWPDLLADRNAKKEAAADKALNQTALEAQVANLTKMIEVLTKGKGEAKPDEGAAAADDDEPLTAKKVMELIENTLNKKNQTEAEKVASEKSEAEEVSKVLSDPKVGELAKPYEAKIKEFVAKHKSVSGFAALCAIIGAEAIQERITGKPEGSNKTATGNRSKTNLRKDKDLTKLSAKDQEDYLRGEVAAGRLSI